ncbi:hypothetical protein [Phascolarctobacterium succinatutens]|nr:hypothetical protein [Phascolarctobacterium succinatutens]
MEKSLQLVFKNAAGSTKIITISNPKAVTWYRLLKLVWSIVTSKFWRKKH